MSPPPTCADERADLPWQETARCGCCGAEAWSPAGTAQGVGLRRCDRCGTVRFEAFVDPACVYTDGYHRGTSSFGWDWTTADTEEYELAAAAARLRWIEREGVRRGRLVDVGGGLGFFAAAAASLGYDAVLCEPVAAAAAHAATHFGLETLAGGVDALISADRVYDVVVLSHTLEHFSNPLQVLQQLRRVLAPGGHLYVEVPNLRSASRRFQGDDWMGWQAGEHVHLFNRRTLAGLLRRAGFDVRRSGTFVPGWDGMLPDGYAHLLGLQPLLRRTVTVARSVRRIATAGDSDATVERPNPQIRHASPVRRWAYGPGFDLIARTEERVGAGTNVRVLARLPS